MNIALEQTEEYVNGQLKNKFGDAFIRGNNGVHAPGAVSFAFDSWRRSVCSRVSCSVVHQHAEGKTMIA